MFGAGWSISFDVGARIYGAEIIVLFGLILTRWTHLFQKYAALRRILGAYVIWVLAIAISDIANGTALLDSARNIATPVLGAASLVFVLSTLSRTPSAVFTFLLASVIFKGLFGDATYGDSFADTAVNWSTIQADTNIFKVRVDPFLTPALILLGCLIGRRNLIKTTFFWGICGTAYFALDSRGTGLVFLLSSALLAATETGFKPKLSSALIAASLCLPLAYVAYIGYVEYTLHYNPLGHNGQQLQRLANPYNPFALLLQARSEWLVWPIAFSERPLFGWGSWAVDVNDRFAVLRLYMLNMDQSAYNISTMEQRYIPVHSLIGAALVWSGILGLIAIIILLKHILSLVRNIYLIRKALMPAAIFFSFMILFHFFFSPPQHVRITFPIALGLLIAAIPQGQRTLRIKNDQSINKMEERAYS